MKVKQKIQCGYGSSENISCCTVGSRARQPKWMDIERKRAEGKQKNKQTKNETVVADLTVALQNPRLCECACVCVISMLERELCVKFRVSLFLVTLPHFRMSGLELFHFD